MKMSELAPKILKLVETRRKIMAVEIAHELNVHIRRVYDVMIILESLKEVVIERSGHTKVYTWRRRVIDDKPIKLNTNSIKIQAQGNGLITRIENHPTAVIIEGTRNLMVEKNE